MIELLLLLQDPCVVLTDVRPDAPFERVVQAACAAADAKEPLRFVRPADVLAKLREIRPSSALVVVAPETLDVNFAYAMLETATKVDDDPFVDFEYGFITGRTPDAALAFLAESEALRKDPKLIPKRVLEVCGPNALDNDRVIFWHRALALPTPNEWQAESLNHGKRGYADQELAKLNGYGFVHLGGHGVPERIEQGLTATQLAQLDWHHAIVWNGACWTGVTDRWFDFRAEHVQQRRCTESFCLTMLERGAGAYFAALHPDHGMPVMQEVEHVMSKASSLGAAIKHTYDGLVLSNGGKLRALPHWEDGKPGPKLERGLVEYYGTAARVLFGDPRIRPLQNGLGEPFAIERETKDGETRVVATLQSLAMRASLTDTYSGDLGKNPMLFNDRAALELELGPNENPRDIRVTLAEARGKPLVHRIVGFAVEQHQKRRVLHVQIDFAADGFQSSAFRRKGAFVELRWKS